MGGWASTRHKSWLSARGDGLLAVALPLLSVAREKCGEARRPCCGENARERQDERQVW